jgi:secondary thiamine-phosphate synthase enzyme
MKVYTSTIEVATRRPRELVDITEAAREEVRRSGIESGLCALYAHGATAALMIQENDDPQVPEDVLDCLDRLVPAGGWRHDRIDDNGAAHIQAGIVGPSEAIPVRGASSRLAMAERLLSADFRRPAARAACWSRSPGVGAERAEPDQRRAPAAAAGGASANVDAGHARAAPAPALDPSRPWISRTSR